MSCHPKSNSTRPGTWASSIWLLLLDCQASMQMSVAILWVSCTTQEQLNKSLGYHQHLISDCLSITSSTRPRFPFWLDTNLHDWSLDFHCHLFCLAVKLNQEARHLWPTQSIALYITATVSSHKLQIHDFKDIKDELNVALSPNVRRMYRNYITARLDSMRHGRHTCNCF